MSLDSNEIRRRVQRVGPDNEPLSIITGAETDEELRELAFLMLEACPVGKHHCQCPFRILNGLSWVSARSILKDMKRDQLIEFFELERQCRRSPE